MTVSLPLANAFYAYVVKSCVNISVSNLIIRMIAISNTVIIEHMY